MQVHTLWSAFVRMRARWLTTTVMIVALLALAIGSSTTASADSSTGCDFGTVAKDGTITYTCSQPLSGSTFAGADGNLLTNPTNFGTTDWQGVSGRNVGIDFTSGASDNAFGQGTKEDNAQVTVVDGSIPPNKSDLTRFYEASEVVGTGSTAQVFLYLAWERSNVLGNANMDFEVNQSGSLSCPDGPGTCTISRTNGDILVTYDFGGSGEPAIGIVRWLTVGGTNPYDSTKTNADSDCYASGGTLPCWGDQREISSANSEGAINTLDAVTDPIQPTAANACPSSGCPAETFGEAAINLTGAGVLTPSECGFGRASTFLKSRSSSSFTSEIKDFIAPVLTPIAPCAPGITTKLSASSITAGQSVTDSAKLSSASPSAGGTVDYRYYTATTDCQTDSDGFLAKPQVLPSHGTDVGSVTVTNGTVPDSLSVKFTSTGTYYWAAFYSGDTNNAPAVSGCSSEPLTVTDTFSAASTQSWMPNDTATITSGSGLATLTGTLTIALYTGSCASSTALATGATAVTGQSYSTTQSTPAKSISLTTTNTTYTVSATTTVAWLVTFTSTDSNVTGSTRCESTGLTITN